jgi:hypothetical protein
MKQKTGVARLDALLVPLGFVRRKFTWNRRSASVVDVTDVQLSRAGDSVTINAGILDPEVHVALWGSQPSEAVEQPTCTLGARIGELIDGRDKWWQLSEAATPADVAEAVATYVVPFLARVGMRGGMKQWLLDSEVQKKRYPPPIISLAIIKSLTGEAVEACTILVDLQKKATGAWRDRAVEVAARMGCTSSPGAR